jgi:hypothetical protein
LQLEFAYLSHHTKNPKYKKMGDKLIDDLIKMNSKSGLFPLLFNISSGEISGLS